MTVNFKMSLPAKLFHNLPKSFSSQLDFNVPDYIKTQNTLPKNNSTVEPRKLSLKQRKKREQAINGVREKLEGYLEKKKKKKRIQFPTPPYDDVFYEALETFDALAETDMKGKEGSLYFSATRTLPVMAGRQAGSNITR